MKIDDLFERVDMMPMVPKSKHADFFYGTCRGFAHELDSQGFRPSSIGRKYLVLVSNKEFAMRMAKFHNCDSILKVKNVPTDLLDINPKMDNAAVNIDDALERMNRGENISVRLMGRLWGSNFEYLNKFRRRQIK